MIAVIICGYNLEKKITLKCLNSVLDQTYKNYKIIYIDDNSPNNNYNTVKNLLQYVSNETIIVKNKERMWPAYSRFTAISYCDNNDICFFIDGDDWLINKDAFKIINNLFRDKEIIASFGCEKDINACKYRNKIISRIELNTKYNINEIPNNYKELISSQFQHPRVTRASILKNIPKEYFLDKNGNWYKVCTDIALFQCVVDMVDNIVYKPRKKYIFLNYNSQNAETNKKEGYIKTRHNKQAIKLRFDYKKEIYNKIPLPKINNSKIILYKSSSKEFAQMKTQITELKTQISELKTENTDLKAENTVLKAQ